MPPPGRTRVDKLAPRSECPAASRCRDRWRTRPPQRAGCPPPAVTAAYARLVGGAVARNARLLRAPPSSERPRQIGGRGSNLRPLSLPFGSPSPFPAVPFWLLHFYRIPQFRSSASITSACRRQPRASRGLEPSLCRAVGIDAVPP
jgi:hypothetical protein